MMSIIKLSVIMLSIIIICHAEYDYAEYGSADHHYVTHQNVVMLNVVAPMDSCTKMRDVRSNHRQEKNTIVNLTKLFSPQQMQRQSKLERFAT